MSGVATASETHRARSFTLPCTFRLVSTFGTTEGSSRALRAPGSRGRGLNMGLTSEMDRLMTQAYPHSGPGAVGLIAHQGKIIFKKAYGLADLELGVPVAREMIFGIGSMTKVFTATAAMLLAERSAIDYQAPVKEYVSGCPDQWEHVTVDNLLSHTSGIVDLFAVPGWIGQWKEEVPPARLAEFVKDQPLLFDPGSRAAYSNSNYLLLGLLIEAVSGKRLDQVVAELILDPLGMNRTYFALTNDQWL